MSDYTQNDQEHVTLSREELKTITDRQDQQIADLIECYKFLEKMQALHEIVGGDMASAMKALTDSNKKAQIQEIMGSSFQDLAQRMQKYQPYVEQQQKLQEGGGNHEQ
jgi:hypothetical protein